MQVETFLETSAARFSEKTALVCGDRRWSYRWMEEECNRLASALIALGVQQGDRVAVYVENSVEAVVSIFAILKAGAVLVPVNSAVKPEKLAFVLSNSDAKVVITHSRKLQAVLPSLERIPELETVVVAGKYDEQIKQRPKRLVSWDTIIAEHHNRVQPPPRRAIDIDMAALLYTSGSTGSPKGVIMTHLNMVSAATSVITYLENTSDDVILNVLPLSFSYGLYQVLTGFKVGATVILERSFMYPHDVLRRMSEGRVTGFAMVPTMSAVLLQMDLRSYSLPSLRYLTNAGAALPTHHVTKLRELFPQARLYLMYGLTECKRVSYLPPDQLDRRPASVGKPVPNVDAYVVNECGQPLPAGEVGELVVRGSNVMKGYWKLPEETEKVLKPGTLPGERVLYTGDLFRMDEDGYLYWIGRKDDIIKSRGEKVSPREIENVLCDLEGIAMAAVVGLPDPVLGQAIVAVITLKSGAHLSENDVLRHCAKHLEDFMVPTRVEFREALPRTAAGKIDKRELSGRTEVIAR